MHFRTRSAFTLVELMIVIAIIGLLAAVLTVAVSHQMVRSRAELERVAMKDLVAGLHQAQIDSRQARTLRSEQNRNLAGLEFWQACFKHKLLDEKLLAKLVGLNGDDSALTDLPSEGAALRPENCSYTAPRMGELREVLNLAGKKKVVLLSHNGRNWGSYARLDYGPLVVWSDSELAEYADAASFKADYKLGDVDWEDPSQRVIGRRAPFHRTFE